MGCWKTRLFEPVWAESGILGPLFESGYPTDAPCPSRWASAVGDGGPLA